MPPKQHKKHKKKKSKEQGTRNPKAFGVNSAVAAKRALVHNADLDQAKYHAPLLDKSQSDCSAPFVVVVQGPIGVGKSTLIRCFLRHFSRQNLTSIEGPVTVVAGRQRRVTFVECPHDLNGMIDCAKFADLVLLLIDVSFGFELETFEFINLLQIHGFPKVLGVLTHGDKFESMTLRNKAKKKLKSRFETEVYKGAKLFCFSGFRNSKYLHHEVKNLARFISVIKIRPLSWRVEHPYLLADRFEDITPESKIKNDSKSDRDVLLYGYLHGANLRPGTRVHVSGVGDFDIEEVEGLVDPCPMPGTNTQRTLNDRERLIYAPMSDLAGLTIDKDAIYIDIPDWKVHYSTLEEDEKQTEGDQMIKELQRVDLDLDKRLASQDGRLFESGPIVDLEAVQEAPRIEAASSDDEDSDDEDVQTEVKRQRKVPDYEIVKDQGRHRKRVVSGDVEIGKWKEGLAKRTEEKFGDISQRLRDFIYNEANFDHESFTSQYILPTSNFNVENDSTRFVHPLDLIKKWKTSEQDTLIKDRFVVVDKDESNTNSDGELDGENDDSEDVFGDFEDLELGETYTSTTPDEVTRFAQTAINKAKQQERREQEKKSKKQSFNTQYDEGGGAKGIVEELNEFKKDRALPSFYNAVKDEMQQKLAKTRSKLDALDPKQRILLEGFRPGTYLRLKFKDIPYEMVDCFSKTRPILIGGLSPGDEKFGCLRLRIKRHRWFPKTLKTRDPLVFSIGWRRFQSLPIYCLEDHNRRIRMLKYTPDHTFCLAVIWGPLCPANTSFGAFQSLESNLQDWRVSASGTVTEIDASIRIMKKLKLIGTPIKIEKTTSFITGMFNSALEVARFEGASIKTVSGIRGTIKKSVKDFEGGGPGTFRASFEDRLIPSDIVFLRSWVAVQIPKFCNPVTDLLHLQKPKSDEVTLLGEGHGDWLAMKTVAQIRRERNLGAPQVLDSTYKPIQRAKRNFSEFKIPPKLVAALPYTLKPKPEEKRKEENPLLHVVPEKHEKKVSGLLNQLQLVNKRKIEKRKLQRARQIVQLQVRKTAEAKRRESFNKESRKERSKLSMKRNRQRLNRSRTKSSLIIFTQTRIVLGRPLASPKRRRKIQSSLTTRPSSIAPSTQICRVAGGLCTAMSKADGCVDVHDEDFSGCTLTTILCSSVPWDDPVFWTDASAVKDAVERLSEVERDWTQPLDEVKDQLSTNPNRHGEFLQFGGVKELWRLLKSGNSIIQRKCLRAIEILAINEEPRKHLREIGIGDTLLELIRASSRRPESTRRAKAAQILKLIAGNSCSARLVDEIAGAAPKQQTTNRKNKKSFSMNRGRDNQASSSSTHPSAVRDPARERPLPLWYHSVHPTLPWDSETVSSLVDLLLSDAVEDGQKCARRVIKKILYCGQISQHIVIDSPDVAELVRMIASMHSTAVIAIKAVTFASIMHSANGHNFIRSGGLEALVNAIKSDNIGSVCGELAAWSLSHFCENFAGSAKKVVDVGGAEALTELAHSFDYCSREAAVHAMIIMLRKSDQDKSQVMDKLGDGGIIQSLLDVLQDGQDHPRKVPILLDTLKALLEMIRVQKYRVQALELDGVEIVQESTSQCIKSIEELGKKVLKWLSTPSQRISRALHSTSASASSSSTKKKSLRTSLVKKLKKFFKNEKRSSSAHKRQSMEELASELRSVSKTEPRATPKRSISSLSSSVQSDFRDGLLATAPGGTQTPDLEELLPETSPTFQTLTLQQFNSTDKDFDALAFGSDDGRVQTLAFVREEDRHELTFSTCTDGKASKNSGTNSELIKTHDFI